MIPIPYEDLTVLSPWWVAIWVAYLYGRASARRPRRRVRRPSTLRPRRRRRRLR